VAIVVDQLDWTFLLAARRPPAMFFLPSNDIFMQDQLEESLARIGKANYLFVPKGPNGEPFISLYELKMVLDPVLPKNFEKDGEGERLIALKRVGAQRMSGAR
jgi:hypothetical protein